MIFFRDQRTSPDEHLAHLRLSGELHVHPAARHEGGKAESMHPIDADKGLAARATGARAGTPTRSCDLRAALMGNILYIKQLSVGRR